MDASRVVDLGFAFDIGKRYFVSILATFIFLFSGYALYSIFPEFSYLLLTFAATFIVISSKLVVQYTEPYTKYEQEIKKFINRISVELELNQILNEIKHIIIHAIQVKDVSFVILNRDRSLTTYTYTKKDFVTSTDYNALFTQVNALWDTQGHDDIITAERSLMFKDSSGGVRTDVLQALEKNKLFLVAPLNRRVTLNGAIFLGIKANNVEFTKNDIDLLEEIIQFSSVAISRALLYQETSTFANKLKIEVKERTKELEAAQIDLQAKNLQIKNAFHELKTLDNAKSEFISIASHQLRTPISIIKGYISMIQEGDFGEVIDQQKLALKKTADNIQQLNDIVEDILNASRIERGKLGISPENTDIIELVKNVVNQLLQKAEKKGLWLRFKTLHKEFITLVDKNKIYEVVMNLIDNAINYTPKGGITVVCGETNEGDLLISVKDTGIGIPDEFKAKMFKRFSRSDNARMVRPDGTGIGLYVAKSFVEAHHGQIWFESVEKKGTTFYVKLLKSPVFDFPLKEPAIVQK
jgi:signal transduction histidine kinase